MTPGRHGPTGAAKLDMRSPIALPHLEGRGREPFIRKIAAQGS